MTTEHWDQVYATKSDAEVSWYQPEPAVSLSWIEQVAPPGSAIVDVGGGTSDLAHLLAVRGYDVTVVDISGAALARVAERPGRELERGTVDLAVSDIVDWSPERQFDVWHDRAALHFLRDPQDRRQYAAVAAGAVRAGGHAVIACFAADGPTHCSGLEVCRADPDDLAALLAPAFVPVRSEHRDHVTPSGAVQKFTWVLLARTPG